VNHPPTFPLSCSLSLDFMPPRHARSGSGVNYKLVTESWHGFHDNFVTRLRNNFSQFKYPPRRCIMVKRKRAIYGDENGERAQKLRKKEVPERVAQSKKLLNRALKTAKGFERQKLGKRLKNATDAAKTEDVERINREIEVLKAMELGVLVEGHLWKTLGKVKAFAENEELLEAKSSLKTTEEAPELGEEEKKAWGNITSGMFNMKPVKDAMAQIVADMYATLGIPPPVSTKEKKIMDKGEGGKPVKSILKSILTPTLKNSESLGEDGADWEGFESGDEEVQILDNAGSENEADNAEGGTRMEDDDIDDEVLNKYQELLGGSSDEESFDEELYKSRRKSPPSTRLSLSLSPSPSPSPSLADSNSDSDSEAVAIKSKSKPPKTATQQPPKTSTFLPTLMGGYWSGSESSASDIEDDPKSSLPIRKNRPGQMARRAIWEKKFKSKANHITQGQATVEEVRNSKKKDDRGAHRGRGGRGRGGFGRGGGDSGVTREARREFTTGDNAMPLGDKKRRGKKDDVGVLHPSWQAAKKAKTEQKTATFAGKKVVFD